jgi:hypothetical protein
MQRAIHFVPDAWQAYRYWHEQDKKTLKPSLTPDIKNLS